MFIRIVLLLPYSPNAPLNLNRLLPQDSEQVAARPTAALIVKIMKDLDKVSRIFYNI